MLATYNIEMYIYWQYQILQLRRNLGMQYCQTHLANFKCPRKVFFWSALPKTATGKIQKGEILEQHKTSES